MANKIMLVCGEQEMMAEEEFFWSEIVNEMGGKGRSHIGLKKSVYFSNIDPVVAVFFPELIEEDKYLNKNR